MRRTELGNNGIVNHNFAHLGVPAGPGYADDKLLHESAEARLRSNSYRKNNLPLEYTQRRLPGLQVVLMFYDSLAANQSLYLLFTRLFQEPIRAR